MRHCRPDGSGRVERRQVSGKYIGNGTPAKLMHAVIVPHEPWSGETAYTIVLSEKDLTGVKKPDVDAMFGKVGHALVVNVTRKGDIFGSQIDLTVKAALP